MSVIAAGVARLQPRRGDGALCQGAPPVQDDALRARADAAVVVPLSRRDQGQARRLERRRHESRPVALRAHRRAGEAASGDLLAGRAPRRRGASRNAITFREGGAGISRKPITSREGGAAISRESITSREGGAGISRESITSREGGAGISRESITSRDGGAEISRESITSWDGGAATSRKAITSRGQGGATSRETITSRGGGAPSAARITRWVAGAPARGSPRGSRWPHPPHGG
jgi:hypothetical protein